jgi:hypothetical protein
MWCCTVHRSINFLFFFYDCFSQFLPLSRHFLSLSSACWQSLQEVQAGSPSLARELEISIVTTAGSPSWYTSLSVWSFKVRRSWSDLASSSLLARGLEISTVTTTESSGWSSKSVGAGAIWQARRCWLGDLDGDRSSALHF